jgi:hypothetical protein
MPEAVTSRRRTTRDLQAENHESLEKAVPTF